ncbi:MAG: hypothetical protein NTV39_04535 [Candidatus Saccharibacteria bacterium]|nr:hypothetical protein [Candidatus Saccharibacteria bacterium]
MRLFYYVFGSNMAGTTGQYAKVFQTSHDNVAGHRRFSAFLYGHIEHLAGSEAVGLIERYDQFDHSTFFALEPSLYLRLVPDFDKFFTGCVGQFDQIMEAYQIEDI